MRSLSSILIPLAVVAAGCSSDPTLYPVDGSVTYNGQPARGALVVFFPEADDSVKAVIPSGTVGDDGKFILWTNGKEGAPAGKYKVAIHIPIPTAAKKAPTKMSGDDPEGKAPEPFVSGPFTNRSTTTLTAEVKSGSNQIEPFRLP